MEHDAPVAKAETRSAVEDGPAITGSLASNHSDPDDGETWSLMYAQTGTVAGLTINSTGSYTFNPGDAAYQHLAAGETVDVVTHYTVTDKKGAQSTADLTITVTGANDAPTGSVTIDGAAEIGAVFAANTSTLSDADGLGTFSFRWQNDGADISGATAATYTVGNADLGTISTWS